jgi:hypothetical protein
LLTIPLHLKESDLGLIEMLSCLSVPQHFDLDQIIFVKVHAEICS